MITSFLLTLAIQHSFALIANSEFDTYSIEDGRIIGWMKLLVCTEGGYPTVNQQSEYQWPNGPLGAVIGYFPAAVAVQILDEDKSPSDMDFTNDPSDPRGVMTKICSNPVFAINRGRELSYVIDVNSGAATGLADMDDWLGSAEAKSRLPQNDECTCSPQERAFEDIIYHACCSHDGIHLNDVNLCYWDWMGNQDGVAGDWQGVGISVWIGFDSFGVRCTHEDSAGSIGIQTLEECVDILDAGANVPTLGLYNWFDWINDHGWVVALATMNVLTIVLCGMYQWCWNTKRAKYYSVKMVDSSADEAEIQQLNQ